VNEKDPMARKAPPKGCHSPVSGYDRSRCSAAAHFSRRDPPDARAVAHRVLSLRARVNERTPKGTRMRALERIKDIAEDKLQSDFQQIRCRSPT